MKKITKILAMIMSGALLISSAMSAAFMETFETSSKVQEAVSAQFEAGAETVEVNILFQEVDYMTIANETYEESKEYVASLEDPPYTAEELEAIRKAYHEKIYFERLNAAREERAYAIAEELGIETTMVTFLYGNPVMICEITAEQLGKAEDHTLVRWITIAEDDPYPATITMYGTESEGTTTPSVSILAGDANGNFSLDIGDVVKIMNYVTNAEAYPLTVYELENADVYCKGDGVNNMDALSVQKKLAGLIYDLPESYE